MASLTQSSARTAIDIAEASEIARMARGGDPNVLSREDMQRLLGDSALVLDGLRRRPRYFDGRFLTGADLTRDQDYVRQRQADLARAGGSGVVAGLQVSLGSDPSAQTLIIEAGHGVTPGGDLVLVTTRRTIVAIDLTAAERLDATLGLSLEPRAPLGRRTGLFILALRPVEFTANPIAAYPTTITGQRQVEDGDVIEATAITLIPYPDTGGAATLEEARRTVARSLFTGDARGLPQDALPLAMVAMERGAIRWIDMPMVRRETGADTPLQVSMGARPRALAEAFVLQHGGHLSDVLQDRAAAGLPPAFAAAQYFAALPAAGQLPAAAILMDPLGFRQLWFPPAVNVDISFIPSDEVASLVEESLTLPPIDLLGDPEDLDATGVVVLAPVTRQRLRRFGSALSVLTRQTLPDPGQGIRRAPADMLAAMLARRAKFIEAQGQDAGAVARSEAADAETRAWQAAWAEAVAAIPSAEGETPLLWYVRRRAVADRATVTGVAVPVSGGDEGLIDAVRGRLGDLGLSSRFAALNDAATPFATARIAAFLGSPQVARSDILMSSALHDLEEVVPKTPAPPSARGRKRQPAAPAVSAGEIPPPAPLRPGTRRLMISRIALANRPARPDGKPPPLSEADVADVASDYGDPRLGDGLERISAAIDAPIAREGQLWLGESGLALDLDRAGRNLEAAELSAFTKTLARAAATKNQRLLARLTGRDP